jgi:hypothetical protein
MLNHLVSLATRRDTDTDASWLEWKRQAARTAKEFAEGDPELADLPRLLAEAAQSSAKSSAD